MKSLLAELNMRYFNSANRLYIIYILFNKTEFYKRLMLKICLKFDSKQVVTA